MHAAWLGVPEEPSEVYVNGKLVGYHYAAGEGTCVVVKSLVAAAMHGILNAHDDAILRGMNYLLDSCRQVEPFKGYWLVPSSLGGEEPAIWDSTSTIATFHLFESYVLRNFDRISSVSTLARAKETDDLREKLTIANQHKQVLEEFVKYTLKSDSRRVGDFLYSRNKEVIESLFLFKIISKMSGAHPVTSDGIKATLARVAMYRSDTNVPIDIAIIAERLYSSNSLLKSRIDDLVTLGWVKKDRRGMCPVKDDVLADIRRDNISVNPFFSVLSEEEKVIDICLSEVLGLTTTPPGIEKRAIKVLEEKHYKIAHESKIRGIAFDLIAEKTNYLKTQVAVARILKGEAKEADVIDFVNAVNQAKKYEPRIAEAYLFASGFRLDELVLQKRITKEKYGLKLVSLRRDQK
jgi:hypothetical protein